MHTDIPKLLLPTIYLLYIAVMTNIMIVSCHHRTSFILRSAIITNYLKYLSGYKLGLFELKVIAKLIHLICVKSE